MDAMWITLSLADAEPLRAAARSPRRACCGCACTPLGSPVVPEVKISSVTSFGSGRSAASSAGSRRSSHGVAMNVLPGRAVAGWPSTTSTCCRAGQLGRSRSDHRRVVEAAELLRDHQDLRLGEPDHEADLAVAVDRDQRVADGADPGGGVVQDEELDPVRQLERHDVAGPDAQLEQARARTGRAAACSSRVGDRAGGGRWRRSCPGCAAATVVEVVGDGPVGQ